MAFLLAVDLGGTKSRFGLSSLDKEKDLFIVQTVYHNNEFTSIDELFETFFEDHSVSAEYVCIAVAGIVEGDRARMTNLQWRVSEQSLKERYGFTEVVIINDLTAMAASIAHLSDDETQLIKKGDVRPQETIAVIAPGTGLGQGYLVPAAEGYIPRGGEGGHAGFSPTNEEELEFTTYLMKENGAVSAEQVCSGPGISLLYTYCTDVLGLKPAGWVEQKAEGASDKAPVVVAGASAEDPCPVCVEIVNRYLAMLGSETANLVLKLYARGGVYIGGGVILHLLGKVSLDHFVRAFESNEKMSDLLVTIPISVIIKEDANLLGALYFALDRLQLK